MAISKEDIGLTIKYLRKKAGLTQEQLAKKMNPKTRKAQVSRIETGKVNYTIDYLFGIAKALNCDISDFFMPKDGHKPSQIIIFEGNIDELKERLLTKT